VYATPDLSGQTYVITGANAGIGRVSALELARCGARVVLACRSHARTAPTVDAIRQFGLAEPDFVRLDLADLESVREAAASIRSLGTPIHGLINNAGLAGQRGQTRQGFEIHFGVNHLGHYLLTRSLIDVLKAGQPSRVVNVASRAHTRVKRLDERIVRGPTRGLFGWREYCNSKLANMLFSSELARRMSESRVRVYALHPGVVATDLWRHLPGPISGVMTRFMTSAQAGAETTLYCATSPRCSDETGLYYARCQVTAPSAAALDAAAALTLWESSAAWVGLDP